jgi:signal transduction histidine kinase
VTITLYRSPDAVHLEVLEEGPGFSPDAIKRRRTLGLISVAEGARLVGGTLSITSVPGEGAKLHLAVPLAQDLYESRTSNSRT